MICWLLTSHSSKFLTELCGIYILLHTWNCFYCVWRQHCNSHHQLAPNTMSALSVLNYLWPLQYLQRILQHSQQMKMFDQQVVAGLVDVFWDRIMLLHKSYPDRDTDRGVLHWCALGAQTGKYLHIFNSSEIVVILVMCWVYRAAGRGTKIHLVREEAQNVKQSAKVHCRVLPSTGHCTACSCLLQTVHNHRQHRRFTIYPMFHFGVSPDKWWKLTRMKKTGRS